MNDPHPIHTLSDEAFGWYLTGLTDGEGCFSLANIVFKTRNTWRLSFIISLRADETQHLTAIARRMNCGVMNLGKRKASNYNSCPLIRWIVTDLTQLSGIIVPHFEQFPLQLKKARDFAIWKQAVPARLAIRKRNTGRGWGRYSEGQRLITPQEHASFRSLSDQLKAVRLYNSPASCEAVSPPAVLGQKEKSLFDGAD